MIGGALLFDVRVHEKKLQNKTLPFRGSERYMEASDKCIGTHTQRQRSCREQAIHL